jgi:hypothetical protein
MNRGASIDEPRQLGAADVPARSDLRVAIEVLGWRIAELIAHGESVRDHEAVRRDLRAVLESERFEVWEVVWLNGHASRYVTREAASKAAAAATRRPAKIRRRYPDAPQRTS